jgi:hypothetical protein
VWRTKQRAALHAAIKAGFATGEMEVVVTLHSSNREARMSALGQKQTFR